MPPVLAALSALGLGSAGAAPALTATAGATGAGSVLAPAAGALGGAFLPGLTQAAGSGVLAAPGAALTAGVPATTGLVGAGGQFSSSGALPQFGLGGLQGYLGQTPATMGLNPNTVGNLLGQLSQPRQQQPDAGAEIQQLLAFLQQQGYLR